MKARTISRVVVKKVFHPYTIEIDVETEEEFHLMTFLFSQAELCQTMREYADIEPSIIREQMKSDNDFMGSEIIKIKNIFEKYELT